MLNGFVVEVHKTVFPAASLQTAIGAVGAK
jgi:hypothetical protein